MLYQYAVLLNPTSKEMKDGKNQEILVPPCEWFVADGHEHATKKGTLAIPEEHQKNIDRIEVAVRPFH